MSLDREQIRKRPFLALTGRIEGVPESGILITVEERDALLAELEQAEVERDALKIAEEEQFTKRGAALADAAQCLSRLAKVPALVEALKVLVPVAKKFALGVESEYGPAVYPQDLADEKVILDAEALLADWEDV